MMATASKIRVREITEMAIAEEDFNNSPHK
jgi:hypothetical protein